MRDSWYKNFRRQNKRHFKVLQAIIEEIVDKDGLVSCPTNSFTYTFDLVEDLLACGGPDEASCFRIVGFDEDLDLGDEILRADKGSAPDLALGYQSEPAFNLIEP